jgi:hypothetical protein
LNVPEYSIIIENSNKSLKEAKKNLNNLNKNHLSSIYSKIAARYVLQVQKQHALNLCEEGIIPTDVYRKVKDSISKNRSRIETENILFDKETTFDIEDQNLNEQDNGIYLNPLNKLHMSNSLLNSKRRS